MNPFTPVHEAWRDTRTERIYRQAMLIQLDGRSTEIMKDLAARQMGW